MRFEERTSTRESRSRADEGQVHQIERPERCLCTITYNSFYVDIKIENYLAPGILHVKLEIPDRFNARKMKHVVNDKNLLLSERVTNFWGYLGEWHWAIQW